MKLSEAKYQYEEKNAAFDRLRSELHVYLGSNGGEEGIDSPNNKNIKEPNKHGW